MIANHVTKRPGSPEATVPRPMLDTRTLSLRLHIECLVMSRKLKRFNH